MSVRRTDIIPLLVVAVATLVFGACYLLPTFSAAPEGAEETPLDEANFPTEPSIVISFTDTGFVPKEVTVKRGDIVRFTNESATLESWPASAVHPTHSIYPEKTEGDCLGSAFDACRGLKPGESWDFRFTRAGEWRFHDHIHASKTGVVFVAE